MAAVKPLPRPRAWGAAARDYVTLCKPRIVVLLAITCMAGLLVGAKGNPELLSLPALLGALLAMCLCAGGANAINMGFDADIDPLMTRTRTRPVAAGRLSPQQAYGFGALCIVLGGALGWVLAGPVCAACALAGAAFYVFIYTIWLKRSTPENIVIGGAAGAFPPLVGWAAVQPDVFAPLPWLMFAIIFFWTPPHFWALALLSNTDYQKAGIPMYPVAYGEATTREYMLRYLVVLVAVSLLPVLSPPVGLLYGLAALGLGVWWGHSVYALLRHPHPTATHPGPARVVFRRSLSYLALIFLALVVDSWL